MEVVKYPSRSNWDNILKRPLIEQKEIDLIVTGVLDDVKKNGDAAVKKYTEKFDKVKLSDLQVTESEFREAENTVSIELKEAIHIAGRNIEKFHSAQKVKKLKVEIEDGITCWQKSVAIEKIGLYIPGGTAPLFSTVLMLGIPAKIAGCNEIILCTPPNTEGKIHPAILYAAKVTGCTKVFKIGGAQAIAAMAYGTETVPEVYKIIGPGNQFVTVAKQIVSRTEVAIDMPAGPSEVAVMADDSAVPAFVALDLLSQAEHQVDSQVLLITVSDEFIDKVLVEIVKHLQELPRKELAKKSMENSKIILVENYEEMVEIVNAYAPEHLIISTKNADELAEKIINAGSVFIGNYTPESAGDYASGTNHTLPTNGYARAYNGVNLDDYVKKITFQKLTKKGLQKIGPAIEIMAETEELTAHKNAVSIRLGAKGDGKMTDIINTEPL